MHTLAQMVVDTGWDPQSYAAFYAGLICAGIVAAFMLGLFIRWLYEVHVKSYPVLDGKPQSFWQRVKFWYRHQHNEKYYDNVWKQPDGTFVDDDCRKLGKHWQSLAVLILMFAFSVSAQPPMPLAAPPVETNEPMTYTLQLEWPSTGETNRVMVDGVQQALAWTNALVTNVTDQLHSIRIITLSGHHPFSQWGKVGVEDGEYRGVRYKVWTNGNWSPWMAWTNPVGSKLPQSAPHHLFEPDIVKPKKAWQVQPTFPLK